MTARTLDTVAGITVPNTDLTHDVTDFIRSAHDDALFHHSRRVFFFGALHGLRQGLDLDLELLYVAAMFHDLGLTEPYRTSSSLRFEVDGADAARDFLLQRGGDESEARKVWLGIALHTTRGIPEFLDSEIALLTAGVRTDVLGIGRDELDPEAVSAVTAVHPRRDFKIRMLHALFDGVKHRPHTTYGTVNADVLARYDPSFVRGDMVEGILKGSWQD
jgi:HD superfamily phosphodiesterase